MITPQRLISFVVAEPFHPFRISMASGRTLEIKHPEMISVGRSTANIHFSMSDDPAQAGERVREVSLLLMETIEPLETKSSAGLN